MSRPPALPDRDARALRVSCRLTVDAVGGPDSAGAALAYSPGNLSASYDPHNHQRWMRVDHALVLDRLAGFPHTLSCMARLQGYQLVPLIDGGVSAVRDLAAALGEAGQLVAQVASALADGVVTDAERLTLLPTVDRCRAALATAHATLSHPISPED